jgi:hypothetical protein
MLSSAKRERIEKVVVFQFRVLILEARIQNPQKSLVSEGQILRLKDQHKFVVAHTVVNCHSWDGKGVSFV